MHTAAIILGIVDVLLCVAMVILVIMQEGNSQGLGTIGGSAETFFGKNKGRSIDVVFKRITTVLAVIFVVVTIALYALINRA